ncbi:MAG: MFS transporter, partial [Chloroflexi bacterium]|nr:MFS transporter [Chloroflexota bacterium]
SPEKGLAAVSAAMGVGAILSGLANLEMGRRYGRGRVALIFTLASPAVFFFLAISQTTGVAAVWAAGFGFTLTMFFVTTNTLLQHEVEEGYRGRIMGLWMLALWGLPLTTTVLMGSVADVIGTDVTYALCALMMVAISLLVIWRNRHWPKLA